MSKTKKSAIVLMIITLISKITGFFRDIILANNFGASIITDAYITALNIPVVLFTGISSSLGTTYIPMFFKVKEKYGDEGVNEFTSNLLNIVVILAFITMVLGSIFTPLIVKLFAMGFKGEEFKITIDYSRILMPSILFIAVNGLVSSYLLANGRYYISGIVTIPFNIICIIAIIIGGITNSYLMIWITLFAYIVQLIFQMPFLRKCGYRHKFIVNIKDENVRNIVYLILPVFLGSYVDQINSVINRTLASFLDTGSITALNYANKLNIFAVGVLVISISTVMYTVFSKYTSQNNMKAFKASLRKCIDIVIIVMIPIMIGMMIFTKPIVKLLFESGSFTGRETYLTSTALFCYCVGMVSFGIRDIVSRGFYSLQDTKTPVKNALISVIVDIIFSIILVRFIGIGGLALSTSIATTIGALLLLISLRKKIGKLGIKKNLNTSFKVVIASIFMGITCKEVYSLIFLLFKNIIIKPKKLIFIDLTITSFIGAIIYLIFSIILNVEEVTNLIKQIKYRYIVIFKK